MNKLLIFSIAFMLLSCKKEKKVETKTDVEKSAEFVQYEIDDAQEKIALLAIANDLSIDTLQLAIKQYLIFQDMQGEPLSIEQTDKIVVEISEKLKLKKKFVARLIYNYKFEMLSKEEIFEKEMETVNEDAQIEAEASRDN